MLLRQGRWVSTCSEVALICRGAFADSGRRSKIPPMQEVKGGDGLANASRTSSRALCIRVV